MSLPTVACVILTWNNFDDTDECLRSMTVQEHPCTIILVDNGSTDGSIGRLKERWGNKVVIVESPTNLGVGSGYNRGVERALELGAGLIGIFNNDIVVDSGLLSAMVVPHVKGDMVAVTSPIITYYDNPDRIWFCDGSYNSFFGLTRHHRINRSLSAIDDLRGRTYPTQYVPNCAVLISRAAIETIGPFDERYFIGTEDVDWCLRAGDRGFRCLVIGEPLVRHKVSISTGIRGLNVLSPRQAYYYARGAILLGRKRLSWPALALYLAAQVFLRFPYHVASMAAAGQWRGIPAYIRGTIAGIRAFLIDGGETRER